MPPRLDEPPQRHGVTRLGVCYFEPRSGLRVFVDADDYQRLLVVGWKVRAAGAYAYQWVPARRKCVAVAHIVTNAPPDMTVDHRNGDTLDNRKSNLRVCTRAENLANRPENRSLTGRFVRPVEICRRLGVRPYHVYMLIRAGYIPAFRLGEGWVSPRCLMTDECYAELADTVRPLIEMPEDETNLRWFLVRTLAEEIRREKGNRGYEFDGYLQALRYAVALEKDGLLGLCGPA